ncbi:MAG: SDR family oxidoreductase [Solirubrobacterales bacterium]|nr:SDR family oxidoreductase [Solirubrobacterales bacterium]
MSDAQGDSLTAGLENARVLVTGGGTGIGRQTALRFAEAGARVAVLGRTRETLERVVGELRAVGAESAFYVADIRAEESINRAFALIDEAWGGVDVLINNAGGQFPKLALDMSINGFRSVVDLNLAGTFICSQAFARSVVARRGSGTVVNVTTAAAVRPSAGLAHAVSARSGVIALTRVLALEWAEYGITVNAVAPGMIDTSGLVEAELGGESSTIEHLAAKAVPLKRAGTAQEVAALITFLASPACGYMTGETVLLDGGYSLGPGMHIDRSGKYI